MRQSKIFNQNLSPEEKINKQDQEPSNSNLPLLFYHLHSKFLNLYCGFSYTDVMFTSSSSHSISITLRSETENHVASSVLRAPP